ncbi:hypothetical protein TNCT1_39910 [Streptomyces sp. 1-11]|nr:hypothetical protein TNCT1_39910 [Streptomyces sp. 1-11]
MNVGPGRERPGPTSCTARTARGLRGGIGRIGRLSGYMCHAPAPQWQQWNPAPPIPAGPVRRPGGVRPAVGTPGRPTVTTDGVVYLK